MIFGINVLNLVSWFIFGLIVGVIAHLIDPVDARGGVLATAVTGIIGALVGGFLTSALFGVVVGGFDVLSFLIAVAGALIFAGIERAVFRKDFFANDNYQLFGLKGGKSKHNLL